MGNVLCSADGHVIEPLDLWTTRLPKSVRDRALKIRHVGAAWQDLDVPDVGRISAGRFRHTDGQLIDDELGNELNIGQRLRDLDDDGIWGEVIYPNYEMLMFLPDHEVAMGHARVYNDYIVETFGAHSDRLVPMAALPLTDVDDAVAEIERVAGMGLRGIMVPTQAPLPYSTDAYERVWAAAQANGMVVTYHIGTGFSAANLDNATNFKDTIETMTMTGGDPAAASRLVNSDAFAERLLQQADSSVVAQRVIISLVGSGVLERYPDLQVVAVEFNAYWLASVMAAMDKACTLGIGQDPGWTVGLYDDDRAPDDQPTFMSAFAMNDAWPYPLMPSEYVKRQVHATLMDDPVAIACRHITGAEALLWGADYPHAEGTYPRSAEALEQLFAGVDPAERAVITGETTARLFGMKVPQPA